MNKKTLLTLLLIFLYYEFIFPQWSTDPNNNLIVGYGQDPHICSDSVGGCYITYNANTSYPRKLVLERINKYGYKSWNTHTEITGELPQQWQAEIVEDGEGGVIISYEDWYQNLPNLTTRVRVQRVDSSGNLLWGQTGVRVTTEEINHGVQAIVSDGEGGCIVVCPNELEDYTYNYRANRINSIGEKVWGDTGIFIEHNNSSERASIVRASDGNYYVQISNIYRINQNGQIINQYSSNATFGQPVPDLEGGIVLSGRVWNGMIPKLVTQRKDSLGNNLWQEPYVEIADSLHINSVPMVGYSFGYYYYSWYGTKNGINKVTRFQALRQDGSKLFSDIGIQISNPPLNGTIIVPLEENRTGFVYYNSDFLPDSLLVQTYDTLGNHLWAPSGVLLSHPPIESQSFTTDKNGGFIIGGTKNEFTIVVQQVNRYGNLGEVLPVPVELISFTRTVYDNKIKLHWITATELNNYGFEIERGQASGERGETESDWTKIGFVEGHGTTTETHEYSFTDKDLLPGKVKYRLKQIDFDGSYEYSNEIEVDVDITPKKYVLHQNYPNPFNPTTRIKFTIPAVETRHASSPHTVSLKVFDILGNEVATLVNETKPAGNYEVEFNSHSDEDQNLSSGVYFYQLNTGSFISTKKMILIK